MFTMRRAGSCSLGVERLEPVKELQAKEAVISCPFMSVAHAGEIGHCRLAYVLMLSLTALILTAFGAYNDASATSFGQS